MNKDRISIYNLSWIVSCLNISKEFTLIKLENCSWYTGSFSIPYKLYANNYHISPSDIKYMLRLRLIYKIGKYRYKFKYKEMIAYYEKIKEYYDSRRILHHKGFGTPYSIFAKQGNKTRPIITDYRYKLKKNKQIAERMERIHNRSEEDTTIPKFIPPKIKLKSKPWAYNRPKIQRELQKDFIS